MITRIGNIIGLLLVFLGISEFLPILVALIYGEERLIVPFFISGLFTIFIGGGIYFAFQDMEEKPSRHEIMLFLFLVWVGLPLFASLPFMITGELTKLTDAYFEATSALTTTGSSVFSNLDLVPKSVLFWRSLLQWGGGVLVFVIAIAIMPLSGIGGIELFRSALPRGEGEGLVARLRYAFQPLFKIYASLTLLCALLLNIEGMNFFDALTTAMSTLSSGGFTNHSSLTSNGLDGLAEFILIPFMMIAATNLTFHWSFFSARRRRIYAQDTEMGYFLSFMFIAALLLFLSFFLSGSLQGVSIVKMLGIALFTAVSALSTTGFLPDQAYDMPLAAVIICSALLFVGGSTGSTAGGFKILRLKLLLRHADREISQLAYPHSIVPVRINDVDVTPTTFISVWTLLFVFLSSLAIITITYAAMSLDFQSGFGLAIANLFSAGGMTPLLAPDFLGYQGLTYSGKWLTSLVMIVGRLEVIAFLMIFLPSFWKN